jgi:hypothetical protein
MNETNLIQTQPKFKITLTRMTRKEAVFVLKLLAVLAPFVLAAYLLGKLVGSNYISPLFAIVGLSAIFGAVLVIDVIAIYKAFKL